MRLSPPLLAAVVSSLALSAPSLSAQVIFSEVSFAAGDQWVEFYNAGSVDVDLSAHSLYLTTKTPNRTNNYWFGIPAGTVIKSGDLLQIVWGGKIPSPPPSDKRKIYTGDSNFNFLFGHGYEPLDPKSGALGLCNTQLNGQVNNQGIFDDWIQWGDTSGFKREQIAISANRWTANTAIAEVPAGASIAVLYNVRVGKNPPPMDAFFFDFTPTPLGNNASPLAKEDLGGACNIGNKTVLLDLDGNGFPIHGNKDFQLVIRNTEGPAFFEVGVLFVSLKPDRAAWGPCITLDLGNPTFWLPFFPTTVGQTVINVGDALLLPSTRGATIYMNALTFSDCSAGCFNAFSNLLKLTISN